MKHEDGASYLAVAALEGGVTTSIHPVEGNIASSLIQK